MFLIYYIICILYCFYQLFNKYNDRYNDGMIGMSPGLDSVMVLVLAWILAPIDFTLTWVKWYKKAEDKKKIY